MTDLTIYASVCPREAALAWDTVWNAQTGRGEWRLSDVDEQGNNLGLAATRHLATSVINLLFTDARCPADHPLAKRADGDLRGWWGDGVPIEDDDPPLGSLLWLVTDFGTARDEDARWAELFAREALAPLITTGAVARIDVVATPYQAMRRMDLAVALFGRDGARAHEIRFSHYWGAVR